MTTCGPTVTIDNPNEPPQEIPSSAKLYKIPEEDSNKHPTCPPERGRVLSTLFKSKLFTYTSTTRCWCCCEWSTTTNNGLFSDAKCGELYPYTLETVTELIRNIDIQSLPVITNEVAIQLLKIQSSKFLFIFKHMAVLLYKPTFQGTWMITLTYVPVGSDILCTNFPTITTRYSSNYASNSTVFYST